MSDENRDGTGQHAASSSETGTERVDGRPQTGPGPEAERVALVTGGGSGIGASIGRWLAENGIDVVLADVDESGASEVADEIDADGAARAQGVFTDVTDPESVESLVETVDAEFGRLDYLFANAGVVGPVDPSESTYDDWQSVIDVNLNGVYLTISSALDSLRAGESTAHIVVTASISGRKPKPIMIPYRVSKAALLMLTHCLAVRLGPEIKVNALCPGPVDTPMMRENYEKRAAALDVSVEELRAQREDGVPLGRAARPEDLHQILELLLFGDAFLTGQEFYIDGGDHQVF